MTLGDLADFNDTLSHGLSATAELLVKLAIINCHVALASSSLNGTKVINNILLRHYCWFLL